MTPEQSAAIRSLGIPPEHIAVLEHWLPSINQLAAAVADTSAAFDELNDATSTTSPEAK